MPSWLKPREIRQRGHLDGAETSCARGQSLRFVGFCCTLAPRWCKQSRSLQAAEAGISSRFFGGIEMKHADTNPPLSPYSISPDLDAAEGTSQAHGDRRRALMKWSERREAILSGGVKCCGVGPVWKRVRMEKRRKPALSTRPVVPEAPGGSLVLLLIASQRLHYILAGLSIIWPREDVAASGSSKQRGMGKSQRRPQNKG